MNQSIAYLISRINNLYSTFCCKVKCCLGIIEEGDENLFLNQQGNFVAAGGGSSQDLQSVTDEGNTSTNSLIITRQDGESSFDAYNYNNLLTFQVISGGDSGVVEVSNPSNNTYSRLSSTNIQTDQAQFFFPVGSSATPTFVTSVNAIQADAAGNINLDVLFTPPSLVGDSVTTTFTVAHGQSSTPSFIAYTFKNDVAASGTALWLTWDATNINLNFVTPPNVGPINIDFLIKL